MDFRLRSILIVSPTIPVGKAAPSGRPARPSLPGTRMAAASAEFRSFASNSTSIVKFTIGIGDALPEPLAFHHLGCNARGFGTKYSANLLKGCLPQVEAQSGIP